MAGKNVGLAADVIKLLSVVGPTLSQAAISRNYFKAWDYARNPRPRIKTKE